ncbi:transcriptional regulator with XRE-family HTH domain [Algoriphagus sp. 4150]|uniref:helix-turn-helix domain-containing protein n=1 Tax=Algoriphagus sp. 4150 TaxID=2817756 RepID=UPI00285C6A84|nr:helix-turn-helix transcriptional regulator [Algoriphagus sp. 4150]MDR7131038.1 transcriptional regulator with XRE-family HTH domain [Algoriphagus sp. 4150]
MVNQKLFTMKQPELGKKISEMRKAKGLTQEELVELCNLNVRTIQRIEAGEVTPRSYTIKALFEALGVGEDGIMPSKDFPRIARREMKWMILSFVAGIIYFVLGFLELPLDIKMLTGTGDPNNWKLVYSIVKILSFVSCVVFISGFLTISKYEDNSILGIATWVFIIGSGILSIFDISLSYSESFSHQLYSVAKLGTGGLLYLLLGFSFLKFESPWKSYLGFLGIIGMITGVLLLTIVGAVGAIFLMALFEIGLLYCLLTYIKKPGRTSSPDSTFTAELQS